jgi:hypothetical protein
LECRALDRRLNNFRYQNSNSSRWTLAQESEFDRLQDDLAVARSNLAGEREMLKAAEEAERNDPDKNGLPGE